MKVVLSILMTWLKWFVKLCVLLGVVGGLVYWVKFSPVSVSESRPVRQDIVEHVFGTGTLESQTQVKISTKISSRISDVLVDQGHRVSAGQLLVRLDSEELEQQVAIASANKEAAEAFIKRLQTDKNRALAIFQQAKKSYDRVIALASSNALSQDDVDKATEHLSVSSSGVSRADAAIAEGRKKLVAASQNLKYHQAKLSDCEIRAPFDGLITKRVRENGDVVVPGSSILTLISTKNLWVRCWIDETEIGKLKPGQMATVILRSYPHLGLPGKVVRLGNESDRETHEFLVDIQIEKVPENWAIGQRAEAYIQTQKKDSALTISSKEIQVSNKEQGVFVVSRQRAEWRPIKIGIYDNENIEVVSGLNESDRIVRPIKTGSKLSDGRRVTVVDSADSR